MPSCCHGTGRSGPGAIVGEEHVLSLWPFQDDERCNQLPIVIALLRA